MIIFKKILYALMAGIAFFLFAVVAIVAFGYVAVRLNGLKYNFHDALVQGVHSGMYLGAVITILAFIGAPRRRPPF